MWGGVKAVSPRARAVMMQFFFVPLMRRRQFSCDDLSPSPLPPKLAGWFFTAAATSEFVSMEASGVARGGRACRRRGAILSVARHCCEVEESFCSRKCLVSLSHTRLLAVPVCDSQGPFTPAANSQSEKATVIFLLLCRIFRGEKANRWTPDHSK